MSTFLYPRESYIVSLIDDDMCCVVPIELTDLSERHDLVTTTLHSSNVDIIDSERITRSFEGNWCGPIKILKARNMKNITYEEILELLKE